MQLGRTNLSGTVRKAEPVKFQPAEVFNSCCELLVTGRTQMRAANNRANPRLIAIVPKPFNGIDQAGMCATEKDYEAFIRFNGEGCVIGKRVGCP